MNSALTGFFSQQDEEQRAAQQTSMDNASAEGKPVPIAFPGKYLCEVTTFAYREKITNKAKMFPDVFVSDTKGSLNLTVNFRVIDGTPRVPKGASIFMNIVLCPNSKNQEEIDKIMRFTKPRLVVLTGTDKIYLTPQWIDEWLLPKFEEKGNAFELIKDHKMKQKVVIFVDEGLGKDDKIRLQVKSIAKALPADKSETVDKASATNIHVDVPPETLPESAFDAAIDQGDAPQIPSTEPF